MNSNYKWAFKLKAWHQLVLLVCVDIKHICVIEPVCRTRIRVISVMCVESYGSKRTSLNPSHNPTSWVSKSHFIKEKLGWVR